MPRIPIPRRCELLTIICVLWVSFAPWNAWADETEFFSVDIFELVQEFDKSNIVSNPRAVEAAFYETPARPRVVVPADTEAYVLVPEQPNKDYRGYRIVGTKPSGTETNGQIYLRLPLPKQKREGVLAAVEFKVGKQPQACTREEFFRARGNQYLKFWNEGMAGAAVFRHLARESLGQIDVEAQATRPRWGTSRNRGVDATVRLTSGGRAISENLQLDRELAAALEPDQQQQSLSKVAGVTVAEIDWKPLLDKASDPELDPLAKLIPHDQYAVFLPNFRSLVRLVDQADELSNPLTRWIEPTSQRTDVLGFYQRQLGLEVNFLTRQLGGTMIQSIALTGSDPYFRTGTDLAVVFQSAQPELLRQALMSQVSSNAHDQDDVVVSDPRINGLSVQSWETSDRQISSHIVATDDAVVVSNSLVQLGKLIDVITAQRPSMGNLDEYHFFRQRYKRNQSDESALVVITDAAIRKWCGPVWRIGASRRTIARSSIAEYTVRHADEVMKEPMGELAPIPLDRDLPNAGALVLSPHGVVSDVYGTMQFQTPIAELDIQDASEKEIKLYETWRDQYQRRWRRVFDPIAIQVSLTQGRISADITVVPLILGTEYRFLRELVGEKRLSMTRLSPPKSLLAMETALDLQSDTVEFIRPLIGEQLGFDPLGWIDDSASIYLYPDQAWQERLANRDAFRLRSNDIVLDIPVAVHFPSKNNLQMTAFTVGFRGMLERLSPNMFDWETVRYRGMQYTMGTIRERSSIGQQGLRPRLSYVTTTDGWTLSLNPRVIEAAINRSVDGIDAKVPDANKETSQLRLQAKGAGIRAVSDADVRSGLARMARLSWSNLPIMNYLRHRYPDRDPLAAYERLFGQTLVEPAGGEYVWNDRFQTYESSLYGHHLDPRAGPSINLAIGPSDTISTTLSFQNGGLRATLTWRRD